MTYICSDIYVDMFVQVNMRKLIRAIINMNEIAKLEAHTCNSSTQEVEERGSQI